MTLKVTEYIPGFCEGRTPQQAEVATWQQVMTLAWLKPLGELVVTPHGSQFLLSDHTTTGERRIRAFVEDKRESADELQV